MTATTTPVVITRAPSLPVGYGAALTRHAHRNPAGAVLERTADLLITDGWCQGASRDDQGRWCLTMALGQAATDVWPYHPDEAYGLWLDVIDTMRDVIFTRDGTDVWLETWNDTNGRSLDDVLDLIAATRAVTR